MIKDTPFDINALKAKRRYEINKGVKNFEVRSIDPQLYAEELCEVAFAAYAGYAKSTRPDITRQQFINDVQAWAYYKCYGAFERETDKLCGYAILKRRDNYIDFTVLKAIPEYESKGVNAALVRGFLEDYSAFLMNDGYISDGSRCVNHQTAFQDYLEKYFGFRKAYCKLHIRYKWWLAPIIACLYPFRKLLRRLDNIGKLHLVNGLLQMEEFTAKRDKHK